jgi:hypothetical protein
MTLTFSIVTPVSAARPPLRFERRFRRDRALKCKHFAVSVCRLELTRRALGIVCGSHQFPSSMYDE